MDSTLARGARRWVHPLTSGRPFAPRHYLLVFVLIGIPSAVSGALADPELVGHWVVAVTLATAAGLVAYLTAGRLITPIGPAAARAILTPVAYGAAGLARGATLVALAEGFAPIDDALATAGILWNVLAGAVLVSAVAIGDREFTDVVALQTSVEQRRRDRRRLEQGTSLDGALGTWTAALRSEIEQHFVVDTTSPSESPETASRRLRHALEERLMAESAQTSDSVAPMVFSLPSMNDRRALFRLTADALERVRLPLAGVMALCVAVFHDLRATDPRAVAMLVSGMLVAAAITVVLLPIVAAACRRLPERTPTAVRAVAISVGLLLVAALAALGDLEIDRVAFAGVDPEGAELLLSRTMVAALAAGWGWMLILSLGPYAEALREENRRESQRIVRLAATQLSVLEQAEALLRDRLRDHVEPTLRDSAARAAAEGGAWHSSETRDRILQALEGPAAAPHQ